MLRLTVSIVVFRPDLPLLVEVLRSLDAARRRVAWRPHEMAVTVVNNEPGRGLSEELMAISGMADLAHCVGLRVLNAPKNDGYGAGNNRVIRESPADFHLVLNPDALVAEDFLDNGLAYLAQHPGVGLLVPDVRGFSGVRHHLCKQNPSLFDLFLRGFAPNWLQRRCQRRMAWFEMRDHDYDREIAPVPYPTGCCMLFRTSILRAIGGFDESFFLYLEDADIGRRINRVSATVYVPACRVMHRWSRGSHRDWRLRWVTIHSAWIYWRKWGGVWRGTPT